MFFKQIYPVEGVVLLDVLLIKSKYCSNCSDSRILIFHMLSRI